MAKRSETGNRTTIYRLTGVRALSDAVRAKYPDRDDFTLQDTALAGRPALLLVGSMTRDEAAWCATLATLTGTSFPVAGSTPAAALIVRPDPNPDVDPDVAYALTYGMGFQLLEPARIDNIFGQRIAVRTADPADLRSVTVTTMDERSRTSRASIPTGDGLRAFGIGDIGEAVSRVVAMADLPTLSRATGRPTQIRGADALNLPIGITGDEVLADLSVLESILVQEPPPELKILEQLVSVKNPDLRARLDQMLEVDLTAGTDMRMGLSWPHERINENGTPDSWTTAGLPRGHNGNWQGQPDWKPLWEAIQALPAGSRFQRLARATILLCRDAQGQEPISQAIPVRKWLAYQTDFEGRTYALHDGDWYQVHHEYAQNIRDRTLEIFAAPSGLELPTWPADEDEGAYNKRLAQQLGGVCLDRAQLKTGLHSRGIEACDVYLNDGTLIHVKRTDRSSPASHLIAQSLVSADTLCNDSAARESLRQLVRDRGGDTSSIGTRPKRVVLVMGRKDGRPITADSLYTFTQVNLVRHVNSLQERNVPVFIATP